MSHHVACPDCKMHFEAEDNEDECREDNCRDLSARRKRAVKKPEPKPAEPKGTTVTVREGGKPNVDVQPTGSPGDRGKRD